MNEFTELIPSLPEDLALECLTRFHYSAHRVAARVNHEWRNLIKSNEFYNLRKRTGFTHRVACLIQSLPSEPGPKLSSPVRFGLSIFDLKTRCFDRVDPVPEYPNGLPLFCQVIGSEGRVVVVGGWDPASYEPVRAVFVYEFVTRRWRRGSDMPDSRSFFAAGELDGKVIIAGGHDENKNALNSAWAYELDSDRWTELAQMSQERDECEGVVVGSEFWVVSGYKTEVQGRFEGSIEKFDIGSGEWRRVEGSWKERVCPRGRVRVRDDGELFCWKETEARVGACVVDLGEVSIVAAGSDYQRGLQGFWLLEKESGKMTGIEVPEGFMGFVQSGCECEI